MARTTALVLSLLLLVGTTACAEQDNSETEATTSEQETAQVTNTQPDAYATEDVQTAEDMDSSDEGLIDQAQTAATNTVDAAAEIGTNAWDAATDKAGQVGDAAVDAGKKALDTVGDAAASAGDAVDDALNFENDESDAAANEPAASPATE